MSGINEMSVNRGGYRLKNYTFPDATSTTVIGSKVYNASVLALPSSLYTIVPRINLSYYSEIIPAKDKRPKHNRGEF